MVRVFRKPRNRDRPFSRASTYTSRPLACTPHHKFTVVLSGSKIGDTYIAVRENVMMVWTYISSFVLRLVPYAIRKRFCASRCRIKQYREGIRFQKNDALFIGPNPSSCCCPIFLYHRWQVSYPNSPGCEWYETPILIYRSQIIPSMTGCGISASLTLAPMTNVFYKTHLVKVRLQKITRIWSGWSHPLCKSTFPLFPNFHRPAVTAVYCIQCIPQNNHSLVPSWPIYNTAVLLNFCFAFRRSNFQSCLASSRFQAKSLIRELSITNSSPLLLGLDPLCRCGRKLSIYRLLARTASDLQLFTLALFICVRGE